MITKYTATNDKDTMTTVVAHEHTGYSCHRTRIMNQNEHASRRMEGKLLVALVEDEHCKRRQRLREPTTMSASYSTWSLPPAGWARTRHNTTPHMRHSRCTWNIFTKSIIITRCCSKIIKHQIIHPYDTRTFHGQEH